MSVGDLDRGDRGRLDELHGLVQAVMAREELSGRETRNVVERRRAEASRLVSADPVATWRIQEAPIRYLLGPGPGRDCPPGGPPRSPPGAGAGTGGAVPPRT